MKTITMDYKEYDDLMDALEERDKHLDLMRKVVSLKFGMDLDKLVGEFRLESMKKVPPHGW